MIAINAATSNTTNMAKDLNCKLNIKLNKLLKVFVAFYGVDPYRTGVPGCAQSQPSDTGCS
jgi:hypothetical protein